jgi:hypothetical protein
MSSLSSASAQPSQATQGDIVIYESGVSGSLEKKGKDVLQWWKKRWCVYECSSNRLTYHEYKPLNDGDNCQKGEVMITQYWDIPSRPRMRVARFDIKGADGVVYAMAATSSEEKQVWMDRLAKGLGPPADLTTHTRAF